MTPEQFLILNFIILVGFAGLFFWGRRSEKPSLSLKLNPQADLEGRMGEKKPLLPGSGNETLGEIQAEKLRDINPMFIYNGHAWDAYEILGIAPGCSMEEIKDAFEKAIQKSDPSSHEFLKAALTSILSSLKKQGYKLYN